MDKSIIIKKRIIEALESLWLSAPEVGMNQVFAFLYERSETTLFEATDQEWLDLVSSYTGTNLKQWVHEQEDAERKRYEANQRFAELIKKQKAEGPAKPADPRPKRGLDALLPR